MCNANICDGKSDLNLCQKNVRHLLYLYKYFFKNKVQLKSSAAFTFVILIPTA